MTNETQTQIEQNDIEDIITGQVDNLAALITVTSEQMEARLRADELLSSKANRTDELMSLVFGSDTPSVENYLSTREESLVAA